MRNMNNLMIRQAKPEDVHDVIPLIYSSGPAEFEYGFTHGRQDAQAFIRYGFQSTKGLFSYQNHYVAQLGDQLVGVGAFYSSAEYSKRIHQLLLQIIRFYPPVSWLHIIYHALQLQSVIPPLPKNTFYLANLSVDVSYRSLGIGRAFIAQGRSMARKKSIPTYTLDVSMNNPRGQALYEREGFTVIREDWFIGKQSTVAGSRRMQMIV